eukprot:scaffold4.g4966.t1
MAQPSLKVLFSDIDGTCAHYDVRKYVEVAAEPDGDGLWPAASLTDGRTARLLKLPPSTTGAQAVISEATLRLYAALRALGVRLVLISGARTSTLLQRLPFLPAADAYVCEGGGRVFYPSAGSTALPTALPLTEDLEWRARHAAAGPPGQDGLPPDQRSGSLWEEYVRLQQSGLVMDASSYTTAFRVRAGAARVAEVQAALPPALAGTTNLGALDVYPATHWPERRICAWCRAGAEPRDAQWLCPRAEECALAMDDDNDLACAALVGAGRGGKADACLATNLAHVQVGRAYVPGFTADSVEAAAEADPDRFVVSESRSVFGTEELLRLLLKRAAGGEGGAARGGSAVPEFTP